MISRVTKTVILRLPQQSSLLVKGSAVSFINNVLPAIRLTKVNSFAFSRQNNNNDPFDKFKRTAKKSKRPTASTTKETSTKSNTNKISTDDNPQSFQSKINDKEDLSANAFAKFKKSSKQQLQKRQKQKSEKSQAADQPKQQQSIQKLAGIKDNDKAKNDKNSSSSTHRNSKQEESFSQQNQNSPPSLNHVDDPILNTNKIKSHKSTNPDDDSQPLTRQQINRQPEQQKQKQQQEWQKFFQEQVKKNKQQQLNQSSQSMFEKLKGMSFANKGKNSSNKQFNQQNSPNPKLPQYPKDSRQFMKYVFLAGGIVFFLSEAFGFISKKDTQTIISSQLIEKLHTGKVLSTWIQTAQMIIGDQNYHINDQYIFVQLTDGTLCKCESNDNFRQEWFRIVDSHNVNMAALQGNIVQVKPPKNQKNMNLFSQAKFFLTLGILFLFYRSIMNNVKSMSKKGGNTSLMFGENKSHRFRQVVNIKFEDVVGMNKPKQEIVEFIDFLKKPQKYSRLGARIPRGALLTGPPGTGKTMLAKACAGQSGVPFFTISGSEFVQMYVGVGATRVRNLFKQAKQASPSIIFIDEIDAVGKKRSSGVGGSGNDQRDNTLNQLLVEMDGFDTTSNVIVFAATNHKKVLDPALTRPGRFDRLIEIELPDIEGRKEIFQVHLKPLTLDEKFSIQDYSRRLATLTPGFSGADIKNLCNQAAIIAAREDKQIVSMIDFEMASERVIGGVEKKSTLITPETKRTVAYHQCGHGVVSWFMEHASPLLKLTIIPRSKGALGYAQYLPNENNVYTRKQLQDQICVILGGRISQEIFFNKISTGASDDLQKAYKLAKAIVTQFGMGKQLGWLSYNQTQYTKDYSQSTEGKIDTQMTQIIRECSIRTRDIINKKKQIIRQLAQVLLAEETIDQRTIQRILGERPFKMSKQFQEYIRESKDIANKSIENDESEQNTDKPANIAPFSSKNELLSSSSHSLCLKTHLTFKNKKSAKMSIFQASQ